MNVLASLLAIGASAFGYRVAGFNGALTGLVGTILSISSMKILFASKESDLARQPLVRQSQRIAGAISLIGVVVGTAAVGLKWGWIGAAVGYSLGILFVKSILSALIKGRAQELEDSLSADGPLNVNVRFRLLPEYEFFGHMMGGRPNRMDMFPYVGATFDCACGAVHAFDAASIVVLRELAGMRLVFKCPNSEALTCVAIKGVVSFKGFKSLFGTLGTPKSQ